MIDELPRLIMYAILAASLLYHLPRNAGGWRGTLHQRLREPLLAVIMAVAIFLVGRWLIEGAGRGQSNDEWEGIGGVLIAFALVIFVTGVALLSSSMSARKLDAHRIADELDALLDPTDTHFVVDDSTAHRPLELLNELSHLIGPGTYAPGQPWATHQWIADRMAAARAVKPAGQALRIDPPAS